MTAVLLASTGLSHAQAAKEGSLLMIGGALRFDNSAVWTRFVDLAGGKGAKVVIIPAAAGNPARSGKQVADALTGYGAEAEVLPIAPRLKDTDYKAAAADPALVAKIDAAGGVYFVGGDQARITQALLADGKDTPVMAAIRRLHARGGIIAGTSAGAAIMSDPMFKDPPPVLDILKSGIETGKTTDRGLGLLPEGWFADQHFLTRGRFARSLVAMQAHGLKKGIGVEEDTAALVTGSSLEVLGYRGVVVMDLSAAKGDAAAAPFAVSDVKLSYLDRGDRYGLKDGSITPGQGKHIDKDKIDPTASNYDPYYSDPEWVPNILANQALAEVLATLIDSKQTSIRGLAFTALEGVKLPDTGFEFTFRKGPGSLGWFTSAGGYESYTVKDIYLDVRPVKLAQPLIRP
jgi:cyanophycinase